jgi:SPP1 family predicted phage head-tail adaptor
MIRSGSLRHIITYRVKSQTLDEYGGPVETWADFGERRAEASPLSGKDLLTSMAGQSTAEIKFKHRYLAGINSSMVILFKGTLYEILGQPVDIKSLGMEHEVMARALKAS